MSIRQNSYRIFKLKASEIVAAPDLNVGKLTYGQAIQRKEVVSIGDNLVFAQLRRLGNDHRTPDEIFSQTQIWRKSIKTHRAEGDLHGARAVAGALDKLLFVPSVVDVVVDGAKKDFDRFRTKGFYLNGAHYEYLCSGAGQIRRNTATFIDSTVAKSVIKALNCGLDEKTKTFPLAKYTAYFALSFSSVLWVREPRVCVIKDFARSIPNQQVDFVVRSPDDELSIERRTMDLPLNCADGQGLIDPSFAKLWAEDMSVGFQPCSFVVRSCFIKGNLATFDFRQYALENGITTIFDRWGVPHAIDDIDVLISESQFKTYKYYDSWDEYLSYMHQNGIQWGVARYNKQYDDAYVLANYQYIQALSLDEDDVKALVQPTVDWIKAICSGDKLPALLFTFGSSDPTLSVDHLYSDQLHSAKTPATRCLAKDINFLNDDYVRARVYRSIKNIIKKAKIGKIWVHGNYQFLISDPVAQCQSALGLEPVGVLSAGEVYSGWWNENGSPSRLACLRSPLIDQSETKTRRLVRPQENEEASKWYQYLGSGIILNTYDNTVYFESDADFDGDVILTTDNPQFIKGAHEDMPIITYEKGKAVPAAMSVAGITATAKKGFGTQVGTFSNASTCLYAMLAEFKEGDPRRVEILSRIKKLREIVGQEIDRIKGADKPSLPKDWKHAKRIEEGDTDEQKAEKYRHNSIVVSKKPYFFRYLYPKLDDRWKRYENAYDQLARAQLGCGIKDLLRKNPKTDEDLMFLRRYRKYAPLISSSCTMNILCRVLEGIDFDARFAKPQGGSGRKLSMLPDFPKAYPVDANRMSQFASVYRLYKRRRRKSVLESTFAGMSMPEDALSDYQEALMMTMDADMDEARTLLGDLKMHPWEFCTYCHRMAESQKSFDWSFAWDMMGEQFPDWISQGKSYCVVRDDGGEELLGGRYSMRECTNREEMLYSELAKICLEDNGK